MSDLAIETSRLRKDFGVKTAVRDLTLSVPRGEVVGFLGPNGAGKTTSVRMLLGLAAPTSGTGRLLDAPLGDVAARARVGFLPEHFRFHEWLTGRELLTFHGRLLGLRGRTLDDQIGELLGRLQLAEAADRRLREYSKGMQQRIGLAQALLNHPELVFLDEPTSGLDPLGRGLVREVMRDLKARGTTVFLNSHLLSEVERSCDRVVFLKEGRVVRQMLLGESDGACELSAWLVGATPAVLADLAQLGEGLRVEGERVTLRVASEEELPRISLWLASRGVGLRHLSADRPSLETLFLELMGGGS